MEKQSLLYGVEVAGQVHFDFTVRLPVVRDTMNALRDTQDACGTTEGAAAGMYYRVAVMAAAIETLGTLRKDEITAEILMDGLNDDDFEIIDAQIEAVKKKRMLSSSSSQDTGPSSSPSADTVSVSSKSGE